MDQGPSKEKKRHHFIPITYLKKFSDNAGKIFAYRKDNPQTALHLRPDTIAFETYYYSQPLPDGGRDNNKLENFFGTLESMWNPLAARLCSGDSATTDFASSEYVDLFTFLILMRVRVPAARDMVEVMLAEQTKAEVKLLDRTRRQCSTC